jgi:uncharacterized protein (TIGR00255 family)
MLKSMTGFGKAEYSDERFNLKVEVRSLNSKYFDLNLRLSQQLKEKEHLIRAILLEHIQRGKTDVNILLEYTSGTCAHRINASLLKEYVQQLKGIAAELNQADSDLIPIAMNMPDVLTSVQNEDIETIWGFTEKTLSQAIGQLNQFRLQEGQSLISEFEAIIRSILSSLNEVAAKESERLVNIRERLMQLLNDNVPKEKIDSNRLEQELIYYIERMDITEEKQRLQNHCNYFLQTMHKENNAGRKLNFIAQEMGREINTLGSKANHAGIQQYVVQMKDELEKIKEQLMNVL